MTQSMIKLIKSTFHNEQKSKAELCEFIMKSTQLSIGEQCYAFEHNFAKYQERKYCVFFNSGSSANLALIQALMNLGRLKQKERVAFSAITWATNVMPLIQLGLEAIPVDVEIDTLNVSSHQLEKIIKKYQVSVLFLTNLLGFCHDIDKIRQVCDKHNITLIEDNCESLGSVYKGVKLGNYGLAGTFSFFVGHHMSTIEGGAVCTDDQELAIMLKLVRAHGWDRNLSSESQSALRSRYDVSSSFYSKYTFYDLGYNLRPTEINGFLGNQQLNYIDEIISKRQANFKRLHKRLSQNENYNKITCTGLDIISNFAYPIVCKSQKLRDELILKCEGRVEIRPIVGGNMVQQPFYRKYMPQFTNIETPNALTINENGLYFGNNPDLTEEELNVLETTFA